MKLQKPFTILSTGALAAALVLPACDDGGGNTETSVTVGTDTTTTTTATTGTTETTTTDTTTETTGNPVDCSGVDGTSESHVVIDTDAEITKLDGIAHVNGDLWINNTTLTNLDALACIKTVAGGVSIFGNAAVSGPVSLEALESVGGSFTFSDNTGVTSLSGAAAVAAVEDFTVSGNDLLTSMSAFSGMADVTGNLVVQINDSLTDISGLTGLRNVGGSFKVTKNPSLCISKVNAIGSNLESLGDEANSSTASNDNSC